MVVPEVDLVVVADSIHLFRTLQIQDTHQHLILQAPDILLQAQVILPLDPDTRLLTLKLSAPFKICKLLQCPRQIFGDW